MNPFSGNYRKPFRPGLTLAAVVGLLICLAVPPVSAMPPSEDLSDPDALNWIARWKGEHDRERLVRETALEYALLNPKPRLNMKFHQELGYDYGNDVSRLITRMIKTRRFDWDVVLMNTGVYRAVAEELNDPRWGARHLVDFGGVDKFRATQKPFILNDPAYVAEYGGTVVGPYIEGFYTILWYNRKVAQKIGIEIKQFDMTFEDFAGYLKAVADYNRRNGTNIVALYEFSDWVTTYPLFQYFFKTALQDFGAAKAEYFSETKEKALLQALSAFERIGALKPFPDGHRDMNWSPNKGLILKGEGLFTVNGSWMYGHWMDIDPNLMKDMVPAELPGLMPADHYMGSFMPQFAVMKDSPRANAGIDFLMFWSRPQIAEKWVRFTKAPTGLIGNLTTSEMGGDPITAFNQHVSNKYQGRIHFTDHAGNILGAENRLLVGDLEKMLLELLNGRITATRAMAEIMSRRR